MAKISKLLLMVGCLSACLVEPGVAQEVGELHPEISWALQYEVPKHDCVRPKQRRSNEVAGQFEKHQRKMAHYLRCVRKVQDLLIQDHQRIVAAVEQGISEQQTHAVVAIIRQIEKAVEKLGEDYVIPNNKGEIDRLYQVGNRSSI